MAFLMVGCWCFLLQVEHTRRNEIHREKLGMGKRCRLAAHTGWMQSKTHQLASEMNATQPAAPNGNIKTLFTPCLHTRRHNIFMLWWCSHTTKKHFFRDNLQTGKTWQKVATFACGLGQTHTNTKRFTKSQLRQRTRLTEQKFQSPNEHQQKQLTSQMSPWMAWGG